MAPSSPLHLCTPHKSSAIINRCYSFFHFVALLAFLSHRLYFLLLSKPFLPYFLVFSSELIISLIWLCTQAFLWSPVSRSVFPERLPENKELPAIDVFICTADPKKEPPFEVMNTVLSAMALDYPPEKLSVYLSDDGGSSLTLTGMRLAFHFAKDWIPFCKTFGILNRCPMAYFSSSEDDILHSHSVEYHQEKEKIERKYKKFKRSMETAEVNFEREEATTFGPSDRYSIIEVIRRGSDKDSAFNKVEIPLLIYTSREKSSRYPHYFKAGALNVLLRVSGIMTNAPYILVLDCDMYCNNSESARQAMCFLLDPKASPSLAFVQFPQKFHNISNSDIYDSQLREVFDLWWPGMDGLQGPILSGTGFYMKRKALYGDFLHNDLEQLKQIFGQSNEYIMSVRLSSQLNVYESEGIFSKSFQGAHFLATSTYEQHTLWGKQIGFMYESVVEDYFTGFILHCKGWTSIFCNPSRPSFLGCGTTNLNDALVQNTRWSCGLIRITISRFSPLLYGLSRMPLLQTMCYAYFSFRPLYSFPLWCFVTLPQLCLFNGIPIYPKVTSSWFFVLSFLFVGSFLKHLQEVVSTGENVRTFLNEQRFWMVKSVTAYTYGSLNTILELAGLRKASFVLTNKASEDGKVSLYQEGKFDFRTSLPLLAPIVSLIILNIVSFIGGVARIHSASKVGNWNQLFGQIFLSFYIIVVNLPIIEGMLLRKDEGRIPISVSLLSLVLAMTFLYLGSMAF